MTGHDWRDLVPPEPPTAAVPRQTSATPAPRHPAIARPAGLPTHPPATVPSIRRLAHQTFGVGAMVVVLVCVACFSWWQTAAVSRWTPEPVREGTLLIACSGTAAASIVGVALAAMILSLARRRGRPLATVAVIAGGLHLTAAITAVAVLHASRPGDTEFGIFAALLALLALDWAWGARADIVAQLAAA